MRDRQATEPDERAGRPRRSTTVRGPPASKRSSCAAARPRAVGRLRHRRLGHRVQRGATSPRSARRHRGPRRVHAEPRDRDRGRHHADVLHPRRRPERLQRQRHGAGRDLPGRRERQRAGAPARHALRRRERQRAARSAGHRARAQRLGGRDQDLLAQADRPVRRLPAQRVRQLRRPGLRGRGRGADLRGHALRPLRVPLAQPRRHDEEPLRRRAPDRSAPPCRRSCAAGSSAWR